MRHLADRDRVAAKTEARHRSGEWATVRTAGTACAGRMRAAHSFRFDLTYMCTVGFGGFLLRTLRNAAQSSGTHYCCRASYLHSSEVRIAHCDLKSHNLIVDEDFNVAVTDFELARLQVPKPHREERAPFVFRLSCFTVCVVCTQSMDANGTAGAHGNRRFCGTPIYAAPEILMVCHALLCLALHSRHECSRSYVSRCSA